MGRVSFLSLPDLRRLCTPTPPSRCHQAHHLSAKPPAMAWSLAWASSSRKSQQSSLLTMANLKTSQLRHDAHNLRPPPLQQRTSDLRSFQHSRPNSEIRPRLIRRRLLLDLGSYSPPVLRRSVQIRRFRAILVRFWRHSASHPVRHPRHRTQAQSTECAYLPRSY